MKVYIHFLGFVISVFAFSCTNIPGFNDKGGQNFTQFGDSILEFSSEYSQAPGPWSSFVVLGKPDSYPNYGDIQTAWASRTKDDSDEYLAIAFDTAQYVDHISIYETYNPGAVAAISVRNADNGSWVPIYNDGPEKDLRKESRIMELTIPQTSFLVDAIKLQIHSSKIGGWNEIDAVSISGMLPLE